MSGVLKDSIGKFITVKVKFIIDNSQNFEYIQGILKEVNGNNMTIDQHIPFCNLFIKDAKTLSVDRIVSVNSVVGNIEIK